MLVDSAPTADQRIAGCSSSLYAIRKLSDTDMCCGDYVCKSPSILVKNLIQSDKFVSVLRQSFNASQAEFLVVDFGARGVWFACQNKDYYNTISLLSHNDLQRRLQSKRAAAPPLPSLAPNSDCFIDLSKFQSGLSLHSPMPQKDETSCGALRKRKVPPICEELPVDSEPVTAQLHNLLEVTWLECSKSSERSYVAYIALSLSSLACLTPLACCNLFYWLLFVSLCVTKLQAALTKSDLGLLISRVIAIAEFFLAGAALVLYGLRFSNGELKLELGGAVARILRFGAESTACGVAIGVAALFFSLFCLESGDVAAGRSK